jgi:hypothetical protein
MPQRMWFTLRIIVLSLWVGAMAGFAFLIAPIVFAHVGPTAAFAASIAASVRAIVAFGTWAALIALLITIFVRYERGAIRWTIIGLLVLATLLGVYETRAIVPLMESTPLQTPAYDALHQQSSRVYGAAFLAAFAALALCARRAAYSSTSRLY